MPESNPNRRTFLKASGAAMSIALIAGCSGDDNGDENGNGDADDGDDGDDQFDGWFDNVDNYDGVEDHTGEDEVTVLNGAGNGMQFEPPAIRVDEGTTVVWEWTGDGGSHDVAEEDGEFQSEETAEEGFEFEHTFDEAGTYRYVCTPHENVGMKGAVVVE